MTAPAGDVEVALDAAAELGEGPVWDPRAECLYFVDILRGHVHRFDPAANITRTYQVGQPVGAIALSDAGDMMLAVRDGFARLDLESGTVRMIAEVGADRPDRRMNDGRCDRAGRFWAGTMALDERPHAGALYRLDPDGRVHTMLRDVTISNGLDWTDDGTRMYYVDTGARSIDAFDVNPDTGALANRRTIARIAPDEGAPDGLVLDAEGFIWVALWGGGAVRRYAPDGTLDRVVRLPVAHPTACAFGGDDLGDLYVTTATIALTAADRARQPLAGAVFRCRPGVAGRPANRFRG